MKKFGILGALTLFLLMMGSAFTFAQDEKPKGEDKPKAEEARPQETKPAKEDRQAQKDEEKAQKEQEKNAKHEEKSRDEMNAHQDHNRPMDEQQKHQHSADNRSDMGRNGNRGGKHIPDDKFRQHFGRQHTFHVQRTEVINVAQPVVVYGGYSFQLVDTWPADWGFDDDCYIDYVDDGYYLFDVLHPGIRIAVIVVG
ncbi:MAG TPA: hypothetical protein VFA85_05545 [Terriglobales bacterium]|nr:hypothetical protein [Terriglobales bacterium]